MEISIEILLTVQIIVVVSMIAAILVQKSDSDGFTGNSNPSSFMTGRAQANLFTKTTAILATIFIINSLVLGYLAAHTERTGDIIDEALRESQAEDAARENSLENALDAQNSGVGEGGQEAVHGDVKRESDVEIEVPNEDEASEVPVE